jgi:hypothetical protein
MRMPMVWWLGIAVGIWAAHALDDTLSGAWGWCVVSLVCFVLSVISSLVWEKGYAARAAVDRHTRVHRDAQ